MPTPTALAEPQRPAASPPAPPTSPTVSIVIPAYNEAASIEQCLLAALDQTMPASEIIVVDNGSTDATAGIVARVQREHPGAPIRLLDQSDRRGITPTRNRGFDASSGEIIGRIDADSLIARDWVARVAQSMSRSAVAAVSGPTTYYDLPFRPATRLSDDLARRALRGIDKRHPFLIGCNMAIRADAWHAIRTHVCDDPDDLFHEDIDLAIHLRAAGLVVGYAPRLRAHVSARRLSTSPEAFRSYTERFERTYADHDIQDSWATRAPQVLLTSVYWWARVLSSLAPARTSASAIPLT